MGVGVHTKQEFLPTDQFLRFSQRTCPIHYFRSKTHVWGWFRAISLPHVTHSESGCRGVHTSTSFFCHRNHFFIFRNEHAQSTTLGPKLMFGVVLRNFAARHSLRKRVSQCIQSTSFCHRNHFLVFHNEHAQSTTLGPKHMFGVVSRNFVAARHPFRKWVSGAYKARVFATGTISSFFATNMPNPLL
jgi:hypothetical protein